MATLDRYRIGVLPGTWATVAGGKILLHQSPGRIVDALAGSFSKCYVCLPIYADDGTRDYAVESDNVELVAQPAWRNAFEGIRHPMGILRAGKELVDCSDVIFVRGTMPYLPLLYLYALLVGRPIVQWMAGDLLVSLKATESATLKAKLRVALAFIDEIGFRFFRRFSSVYMITSGCELYKKYKSPRTTMVVSSTISEHEFYYREDTCQKDPVRILFVGFVRPGKGLEYLVEALGKLKTSRQVQLAIVGGTKKYSVAQMLVRERIDELGLTAKVSWEGYARFGPELFDHYRRSDMLVLPTLSEGAPHVLVEARAFGLPVVSTRVGGIPSSVKDGEDGILVPPRDSQALASAIDKVIEDSRFRKALIANGYMAAKAFSFEKFTRQLLWVMTKALRQKRR